MPGRWCVPTVELLAIFQLKGVGVKPPAASRCTSVPFWPVGCLALRPLLGIRKVQACVALGSFSFCSLRVLQELQKIAGLRAWFLSDMFAGCKDYAQELSIERWIEGGQWTLLASWLLCCASPRRVESFRLAVEQLLSGVITGIAVGVPLGRSSSPLEAWLQWCPVVMARL